MIGKVFLFVSIACVVVAGQGMTGVEKIVKPGDKLHYYVSFDGPLQEHAHVAAGLILQTSLEKGQEQFGQDFTAQQRGKVSETVYELEAIVPGAVRLPFEGDGISFGRMPILAGLNQSFLEILHALRESEQECRFE